MRDTCVIAACGIQLVFVLPAYDTGESSDASEYCSGHRHGGEYSTIERFTSMFSPTRRRRVSVAEVAICMCCGHLAITEIFCTRAVLMFRCFETLRDGRQTHIRRPDTIDETKSCRIYA